MQPSNDVERRLTELEIKAGFTEDLLDTLNTMVARQQETIETLVREIARLRERHSQQAHGAQDSPRDELPPHY